MERRAKILIVDDDPTITALLKGRLTDQGYDTAVAVNGQEALAQYCDYAPDIIILDIIMPVMDGYSFVLEFKKIGDVKKTPIIILTSKDSMQDVFKMEGINDYIVKPFNMDDLLRKIEKRLESKCKRILVVDDEEEIVEVIKNRLTSSGYDVITAFDGISALNAAKLQKPDLMILDIMMPKLDGYNVCRILKFDQKYRDICVVFLTALARDNARQIGQEVGADAYLTKPYDGSRLLQTIKELLWD